MGLLDGNSIDLSSLQGLFGSFGPTEEEKHAAKMAALAQFGLGLMGAPKGGEFARVGQAGMGAMAAQQESLQNARMQKMQGLQGAAQAASLQEMLQKQQDAARLRQAMAGFSTEGQSGSMPAGGSVGAQQPGEYERLIGLAKYLESKGLPEQAMAYYAQAEKFAPQYDGTETLMQNGKPVVMQKYKNRPGQVLSDYQPKPDFKQVDTGGGVGFVDPLTGHGGPSFAKTTTPDALLSAQTAMRGQNMVDARSRDSIAQAGKPQIVTNPQTGEVFAVDARTATGQPVMGPDGKPMSKGEKALTEVQGNATAFGMRMKASNDIINGLESKGYDTSAPKNLLAGNRLTNYAASPEAQALYQAKLNFMTASLRKESGAAISQSEFDSEDKKYFPQPGDKPASITQKRQMRDLALKAMAKQAGQGAREFNAPTIDDLVKKYAK